MPVVPQTPYTADLGDRDPIAAIGESIDRLRSLTAGWTTAQFERTRGPGKWSARQILVHLAQTELGLGARVRMALTIPNYEAQSFDQDLWAPLDAQMTGRQAADTYAAIATMNRGAFAALTPAQRAMPLSHPEYGALTVDWIVHQMAGHQVHHLKQLEAIAAGGDREIRN
jgi:hypothetical protein